MFTKAPIFQNFNLKYHIWFETNVSGYAISRLLSQLTSKTNPGGVITKADLGQWYSVVFFFRKMIPNKTWYKNHDGKLLAIIEAFKTWRHYLKSCIYEVFVFIDYNNLCCFMDTKSLSFK